MTYETIRYDVKDGVAVMTLSRPEKLNAFTGRMMHEMIEVLDRVDADDAVRALIVTGDGRAFCAGADLSSGASTFDVAAHGDGKKIDYSDDAIKQHEFDHHGSRMARRRPDPQRSSGPRLVRILPVKRGKSLSCLTFSFAGCAATGYKPG